MPTAEVPTLPATRAEIFERGLKDATGTIVHWTPKHWGFIRLHGPLKGIDLFLFGPDLPNGEIEKIASGSRIIFNLPAGQPDLVKPKPRVANPRLLHR